MWKFFNSFLQGAASVLDLFGTLGPKPRDFDFENYEEDAFRKDAEALRSDWEKVIGKF